MCKIICTICDGEIRVPGPDGREATAYYTDDKGDAIATAYSMYGLKAGDGHSIRFRKVEAHPEGR